MKDIVESNRIKKETCNNCKDAFYSAAEGYLFNRKEH